MSRHHAIRAAAREAQVTLVLEAVRLAGTQDGAARLLGISQSTISRILGDRGARVGRADRRENLRG